MLSQALKRYYEPLRLPIRPNAIRITSYNVCYTKLLRKRLIQDFHAGSIILFSRNFPSPQSKDQTPKDVARLTDLLQNFAATQAATRIPLLIRNNFV